MGIQCNTLICNALIFVLKHLNKIYTDLRSIQSLIPITSQGIENFMELELKVRIGLAF